MLKTGHHYVFDRSPPDSGESTKGSDLDAKTGQTADFLGRQQLAINERFSVTATNEKPSNLKAECLHDNSMTRFMHAGEQVGTSCENPRALPVTW